MVLEEMLEHSDGEGRVAVVSVRSLAASLGVAKDTVHRAITCLRDLGLIEPHQARTAAGSYSTGGYRLDVPAACLSIVDNSPSASTPAPPASRRRTAAPSRVSDQLSLLLET